MQRLFEITISWNTYNSHYGPQLGFVTNIQNSTKYRSNPHFSSQLDFNIQLIRVSNYHCKGHFVIPIRTHNHHLFTYDSS
jgi:hypothetical protein